MTNLGGPVRLKLDSPPRNTVFFRKLDDYFAQKLPQIATPGAATALLTRTLV
jgi:hypothetical protein